METNSLKGTGTWSCSVELYSPKGSKGGGRLTLMMNGQQEEDKEKE